MRLIKTNKTMIKQYFILNILYREPADEMQTTNDEETVDTNETNNRSKVDASRLDGGAIQNENVSLEQHDK